MRHGTEFTGDVQCTRNRWSNARTVRFLPSRCTRFCAVTLAALLVTLSGCGGGSGGQSIGTRGTSSGASGSSVVTSGGSGVPGPALAANAGGGTATLVLNIAGTSPGVNADVLNVAGPAQLDGALIVNFIGSFVPAKGQAFTLINAKGGLSGSFKSITTNGINVTSQQTSTTYLVTVN